MGGRAVGPDGECVITCQWPLHDHDDRGMRDDSRCAALRVNSCRSPSLTHSARSGGDGTRRKGQTHSRPTFMGNVLHDSSPPASITGVALHAECPPSDLALTARGIVSSQQVIGERRGALMEETYAGSGANAEAERLGVTLNASSMVG